MVVYVGPSGIVFYEEPLHTALGFMGSGTAIKTACSIGTTPQYEDKVRVCVEVASIRNPKPENHSPSMPEAPASQPACRKGCLPPP